MKLCENCHNSDALPLAIKTLPSVEAKMSGSPSGTPTFFFPTEPGKFCYYCLGRSAGRISKLGSDGVAK